MSGATTEQTSLTKQQAAVFGLQMAANVLQQGARAIAAIDDVEKADDIIAACITHTSPSECRSNGWTRLNRTVLLQSDADVSGLHTPAPFNSTASLNKLQRDKAHAKPNTSAVRPGAHLNPFERSRFTIWSDTSVVTVSLNKGAMYSARQTTAHLLIWTDNNHD